MQLIIYHWIKYDSIFDNKYECTIDQELTDAASLMYRYLHGTLCT